jgi:hypothetical protein
MSARIRLDALVMMILSFSLLFNNSSKLSFIYIGKKITCMSVPSIDLVRKSGLLFMKTIKESYWIVNFSLLLDLRLKPKKENHIQYDF